VIQRRASSFEFFLLPSVIHTRRAADLPKVTNDGQEPCQTRLPRTQTLGLLRSQSRPG